MVQVDGKTAVHDATFVTHVSLAVALLDSYTSVVRRNGQDMGLRERPLGRVRVLLRELAREGRVNPSGYYLFLNIPDGSYTLRVEAEHYLDEEVLLHLPTSPPHNPLVSIVLQPRASYPFPPGATLIRGVVQDATRARVAEATVDVVGKQVASRSSANGEFVLAFGPLKETDIIRVSGRPMVRGNGDHTITVRAQHPQHGVMSTPTEVQEGTAAFVTLIYA